MNKKTIGIIIGIIGVALLIGIACIFLLGNKTYKVKFVNNGTNEEVEVKSGESVSEKTITDKGFAGWYIEGTDEKFDFSRSIDSDYTLVAKYKKTYTVEFDTDGGDKIEPLTVYEGEKALKPKDPTKDLLILDKWMLDGEEYDFDEVVKKDIKLKATYKENDAKVKVTFDTDGGSEISPVEIKINTAVTRPANPTKAANEFAGWTLEGEDYDFSKTVTKDITLKAKWNPLPTYTVKFVNEGKVVKTKAVEKGKAIGSFPANPTKAGYVFTGWYSGNSKVGTGTKVNNNLTLTAKYITVEQNNYNNQVAKVKNTKPQMDKGGQDVAGQIQKIADCTVTATNTPATIERAAGNTTKTVTYTVTCGSTSGTVNGTVIIKASPYKYTKVANSNMLNHDVTIQGGTWNGNAKLYLGTTGSFNVVDRKAVVENGKIASNPTFKLRFNNDASTTYVVPFKG